MRQSRGLLAIVAFLAIAAVVTYRWLGGVVASGVDGGAWAMADFRNAVYYPVVAWLHGAALLVALGLCARVAWAEDR